MTLTSPIRPMEAAHSIQSDHGLLLVGHGTRDPRGQQEFFQVATQLRMLCRGMHVEPCFLELASPAIDEGIAVAYRSGVRRLTVMPLLLFAAGHAKRDIPAAVEQALAPYADLQLVGFANALDCHPAIVWLSEMRYRQSLCGREPVLPEDTALVMIGRGSNDTAATMRMRALADLRLQRTPVGRLDVGFIAMQSPTLAESLQMALDSGCRRIVLQPHLLFQGELLDQVRLAAETAPCSPQQHVVVTRHLAPAWPLARAIVDLMGKAAAQPASHVC